MPPLAAVAVGLLAACGSAAGGTGSDGSGTAGDGSTDGAVTVLAAASLSDVGEEVARRLEAREPDLEVRTSYAGSSALTAQVLAGAPADVLVTASPETLAPVLAAGAAVGEPVVVARNALALVVAPGNPHGVRGLGDLARDELVVALCAPEVPCGAALGEATRAAGVDPAPDTLESDVRAVLTRVRLGEADVGAVYRTDVRSAEDDVDGVPLAVDGATVTYPGVVLRDAGDVEGARAYLDVLTGPEGRELLRDAGFLLP